MRTRIAFLSLLAALSLSACYESTVPIATTPAPFDSALVGEWETVGAGKRERLSVLQFDNGYYYLEMPWDFAEPDTSRLRARVYLTDVEGTMFVNVQDIQSAQRSFMFFKLTRHDDGSITLHSLKDYLPRFPTSEQLRAYLREHLADRAIYGDESRFRKVSSR